MNPESEARILIMAQKRSMPTFANPKDSWLPERVLELVMRLGERL
jgi:hypothetical protein